MILQESILQENKDRFVLFPIKHKEIWDLYKKIEHRFWTPESIFNDKSKNFCEGLSKSEKDFLIKAISFLILKHRIFGKQSLIRFMSEVQYPEARCFFGFSEMMSNVYNETLCTISSFLCSQDDLENNVSKLMESDSIKSMVIWLDENYNNESSFAKRLVVYSSFKRIIFSGLISNIVSLKLNSKIEEIVMLMDFIFEDEGIYTDFSISLYSQLDNKENNITIKKIIKEVVELEINFMKYFDDTFSNNLLKLNEVNSYTYHISSLIEESVLSNSIKSKYNNPFSFMKWNRSFVAIDKNKKEFIMDKTISFDSDF